MVATTLPCVGMLCSAWTVINTLDDILYITKSEDMIHFFVSNRVYEIHMSEAGLLWECILIGVGDKIFQLPDWFVLSNVSHH